jgi:flagellar protein FlaG
MSAETFVNALFLITAVVAAGILITAVFPIVWNMAGTFSAASHDSDTRIRTDFKIVTTYANHNPVVPDPPGAGGVAKIWLKNIGSNRVGKSDIENGDVFIGLEGDFARASFIGYNTLPTSPYSNPQWTYVLSDTNNYWDIGETMEIDACSPKFIDKELTVYFQFVLPNGVWRSTEFPTS